MTKEEIIRKKQEFVFNCAATYFKDPMVIDHAKGQYVWDIDGNQFLDFLGGIVTVGVGHSNPRVTEKMKAQIDKVQHTSTLFITEAIVNLAEKVASIAPGKLKKSYFTNSGSEANEVAILTAQEHNHPLDELQPCVTLAEVLALKRAVEDVRISGELKRYAVDLVAATRGANGVQLGASPRASISLMKTAQAEALFEGNDFVAPEQIQKLAVPVIAHRLVLEPQARFSGVTQRGVVEAVLKKLPVPA